MAHHAPFKSLGPVAWDELDQAHLDEFLARTFADAHTVIDSIPSSSAPPPSTGRVRSATDSAVRAPPIINSSSSSSSLPLPCPPVDGQASRQLRREWRAVKAGGDNPHAIALWKLAGQDGKGTWFARRSVHEGVPFEKWRLGLEREFAETLARRRPTSDNGGGNGGSKGAADWEPVVGNVRGIGAEKRVERKVVMGGKGKLEVYLLSVQFPGPTTPRDFVTLLMSSESISASQGQPDGDGGQRHPRQYMLVSKPCVHPECGPRQGFIRGQYESVEMIREVPIQKPLRRTRSSIDIRREDAEATPDGADGNLSKAAMLRAAGVAANGAPDTPHHDSGATEDAEQLEFAIEWLMVTRSDPGGSVPRFMVEKGTPGGIVNDAGRFMTWLMSKNAEDFAADDDIVDNIKEEAAAVEHKSMQKESPLPKRPTAASPPKNLERSAGDRASSKVREQTQADTLPNGDARRRETAAAGGFYGMIAGALEASGSLVSRMSTFTTGASHEDGSEDDSYQDDTASLSSAGLDYASAEEGETASVPPTGSESPPPGEGESIVPSSLSIMSADDPLDEKLSPAETKQKQQKQRQHEKELKRLRERREKLHAKLTKMEERATARQREDDDRDARELARMREKHERELARQEEKYQRELRRLVEKRAAEERRAAEKQRRAREEQRANRLQVELDKTRIERDEARKQIEALKDQIGLLQAQNTRLVARLGKLDGGGSDVSLDVLRKELAEVKK